MVGLTGLAVVGGDEVGGDGGGVIAGQKALLAGLTSATFIQPI